MGIWAFCLFIVIVLLLFLFSSTLSDSVNKIDSYIERADKLVEEGNYEEAKKIYNIIEQIWKKSRKKLLFQIDKSEFDEIDSLLIEIKSYFKLNSYQDYFTSSNKLKFFLNNLYHKNIISLETIL